MKTATLFGLSLRAGALALGSPVSAAPDYQQELIESLAKIYDMWQPGVARAMITPGKTYAEMKAEVKNQNEKLLVYLRGKQCKDKAHAEHIERAIHKVFHEWYRDVAPDIKHGVHMSCSPANKLVPTLWITDFKLLPKWEKGVKKG